MANQAGCWLIWQLWKIIADGITTKKDTNNMNKTYSPKPIDTSNIELPVSLEQLLEKLAANTHEVWALRRINEGWTYGPIRDDANKKHPCLVPYQELAEPEKEYDRDTATEALKVLLSMGYTIERS